MARRSYRRSSARSDTRAGWLPKALTWPVVYRSPIAPYISVLAPRVSVARGMCSPDDIAAILRVGLTPAFRTALAGLTPSEGPEPRLSGDYPPRPESDLAPPVAPIVPVQPNIADFVAPADQDSTLRRLSRAVFGEPGPSFDERQRYNAAMRNWEVSERRWKDADRRHQESVRSHKASLDRAATAVVDYDTRRLAIVKALAEATEEDRRERSARAALVENDAAVIESLLDDAVEKRAGGVARLAKAIWNAVPLPADFPRASVAEFETETGVLLFTIEAPDFERVALTTPLKTSRKVVGERVRRMAQQAVNHVLPLRLAHEVFATVEMEAVQLVGVNVQLAYIDRRNGQHRHEIVASMMATREEFEPLNIAEVEPKKCFRALRGVETPSYDEVTAVKPLLKFDRDDKRIVEGRSVVDALDVATNLAAMDWEDFEHVVRELFAKMFSARSAGAEVHVTRASRDYGVDALVYDPDPIMGGKYVIQAKRYVNTVEVAAVRDLFGTVQNEGASKGFLVTTSAFGPDAHQFAKGKPLTLIDGSQLLGLLSQFGYSFRIDLKEARQVLHGR